MNTNRKNQSLLISSIKTLARDYKSFFLSFFGVMTVLYLAGFIFSVSKSDVPIGGIESVYLIACLTAGLATFRENFVFLAQNQVPKSTMTKAFIIEGFCFGLIAGSAVNVFSYLMQKIASALSLYIPGFLDLLPAEMRQGGLAGLGMCFVILSLLYTAVYFFGLMLSTINYRLNWLGRVIFWVPFGVVGLNVFIGTLQFAIDKVAPEDLDVPAVSLAKLFIYGFIWLLQSFGNFVMGTTVVIAICLVVWSLTFRGAEIKYSKVST